MPGVAPTSAALRAREAAGLGSKVRGGALPPQYRADERGGQTDRSDLASTLSGGEWPDELNLQGR
jgi:hypothetical protein